MPLNSKFKKDISTLRDAIDEKIFLDVKNPKLYKKVKNYYVREGLVEITEEDPEYDYNIIMACIAEDLVEVS